MNLMKFVSNTFKKKQSNISVGTSSITQKKKATSKKDYDSTEDNQRELQSYREAEIEQYTFLAALDITTCDSCGNIDLKVFNVSEAIIGKNYPPMHEGCRCTTVVHYGPDARKKSKRHARNPVTGKNELVPGNMDYKKWKKKHGL